VVWVGDDGVMPPPHFESLGIFPLENAMNYSKRFFSEWMLFGNMDNFYIF